MHLLPLSKISWNPSKGVDEWKKIMSSFGVGEFLNNDFAVGAKEESLPETFMREGLKPS